MCRAWLRRSNFPVTVALTIIHGISDLPLGKGWIQDDGIVLDISPMGPILRVWIGQTLWVLECTVRDWDAAISMYTGSLISWYIRLRAVVYFISQRCSKNWPCSRKLSAAATNADGFVYPYISIHISIYIYIDSITFGDKIIWCLPQNGIWVFDIFVKLPFVLMLSAWCVFHVFGCALSIIWDHI